MTDVHELLRTKENKLALIRKEIEALRIVAPLLSEPDAAQSLQSSVDPAATSTELEDFAAHENAPQEEGESSEMMFDSVGPKRSRLRDWLGRAVGE